MSGSFPSILIVVRAGRNSLHRSWSHICHQVADIAISTYDDSDWSGPDVNYLHHAPGGKFTGIKSFFDENPNLIDTYDYFCIFDDDLILPYSSLATIRALLAKFSWQLATPSLSCESFFSWPITVQNQRMLFRAVDFVEIMAPIMSRDFLRITLPHFDANVSSWGLEWLWRQILRNSQTFAVILDAAPIVHTRPLGQSSLYKNLSSDGLRAEDERDALIARFGLDRNEPFRNLFGVSNDEPPRLLVGDDLVHEMIGGYRAVSDFNFDNFSRCLIGLLQWNRPLADIGQVRGLNGFARIEDACVPEPTFIRR